MRFKIPYVFKANARRFGKRSDESVLLGDHVVVDIREVSNDDAPVAVRWKDRIVSDDAPILEGRLFEGRFYRSKTDRTTDVPQPISGVSASPIDLQRATFSEYREAVDEFERGLLERPSAFSSINGNSSEVARDIEVDAASMLLVDGMLFEVGEPPLILANCRYGKAFGQDRDSIEFQLWDEQGQGAALTWFHFALADFDKTEEWGAARLAERGLPSRISYKFDLELLLPGSIPQPSVLPLDIARHVREILERTRRTLGNHEDGFVDAWQELRRALRMSEGLSHEDSIELLGQAWEAFDREYTAEFKMTRTDAWGRGNASIHEDEFHQAFTAMKEQWDNRSISIMPAMDVMPLP